MPAHRRVTSGAIIRLSLFNRRHPHGAAAALPNVLVAVNDYRLQLLACRFGLRAITAQQAIKL
jgi:hypothetical protein